MKNINKHNNIGAFSLAETIMTTFVLCIIFVLFVPNVYKNFTDKALDSQKKAVSYKFKQGMDEMWLSNRLSVPYASTEDFVEEMKRHFSIIKTCKNNDLSQCFAKNFYYKEKTYDLNQLKTIKNLHTESNYKTNIVGLTFFDGVRMLITYNPDCIGPSKYDINGDAFKCIGYIIDVNGPTEPDTVDVDILTNIPLTYP